MDPGRVAAIRRMPEPRTMNEVRAFLGTAIWYCRLVTELTESLKKTGNSKFFLSPEAQLADDGVNDSTSPCACAL